MCEAIYIAITQQAFKRIMDGHFSNPLCILKNWTKTRFICCPFRTALYLYHGTYGPTQVHDVQGSKTAIPDWCHENIHKTQLQFMYGGTFNDPKKYK